mmetsp:Transcript_32306/g.36813  ORF Transcript_32306/g.36813 Transcript_32306/m.36813 type:complete len:87 (+) Transcript_32306:868-1128(+)
MRENKANKRKKPFDLQAVFADYLERDIDLYTCLYCGGTIKEDHLCPFLSIPQEPKQEQVSDSQEDEDDEEDEEDEEEEYEAEEEDD